MKKLIILVLSLNSFASFSQSSDENVWRKSSQSISLSASTLLFATPINLSYNQFWHNDGIHYGVNAGASFVFYELVQYASVGVHSSFGVFLGRNSHHPELKFGIAYTPLLVYSLTEYTDYNYPFVPVISVGYRYQNPGENDFYRVFIGTGGIGIGMGWLLETNKTRAQTNFPIQ
jgi:hypothetical protein